MRRTLLRMTAFATMIAVLGGCTEPESSPTPDPTAAPTSTVESPPSTPGPTVDPAQAEAEAAVLAAYQNYWDVSTAALADPLAPLPDDFDRFIVDEARAGLAESLLWAEENEVVMVGAPAISPTIESIDFDGERAAHIVDCVDSTNWVLTSRSTGDPASSTSTQSARVAADAWAMFYDDRWVIRDVKLNRDQPC